jgi:hypothetical protein
VAEELFGGGQGGANLTAAQSIQTQNMIAMTLAGNSTSAGAGYILMSSGTVRMAGGANITMSQNGNSVTVIGGAGGAFSAGVSSGGNTAGTTGTVGNGLLFFGGSNVTLSQSSAAGGASISFISPAPGIVGIAGSNASTVSDGTVQFANSNGLTFGLNGSTITASHDGITSQSVQTQGSVLINGSSGAISFNAGNLISLSTVASNLTFINLVSSATNIQEVSSASAAGAMVSRFANEGHVHPGVGPAGVSNVGNTSGNTGALFGRLILAGGNNITLSVSTSNNNAQTITISHQEPLRSKFYWAPEGASTASQQNNSIVSFQAVELPYDISFSRVEVPFLLSLASSATANTANILISSALVIHSVSAATRLNPIAGAIGTTTHTWASNTSNFGSLSGGRMATFPIATTLSAGLYHIEIQLSTANTSSVGSATTQLGNSISLLLGLPMTASGFADLGASLAVTTDILQGRGVFGSAAFQSETSVSFPMNFINNQGGSKLQGNFGVLFRNY